MKIKIILLIALLMLPLVIAQENSTDIFIVPKCYGQIEIKVRGDNITTNDFSLLKCSIKDDDITRWICPCIAGGNIPIVLESKTERYINFDFVIEYDLEYSDENIEDPQVNKRTENINNFELNPEAKVPKKKKFVFPDTEGLGILIGIGFIAFIFISIIVILIFRKIMKAEDNILNKENDNNLDDFINN